MARSHVCPRCGFEMARLRGAVDASFGAPVVVCPSCGRAAVKMFAPRWNRRRAAVRCGNAIAVVLGASIVWIGGSLLAAGAAMGFAAQLSDFRLVAESGVADGLPTILARLRRMSSDSNDSTVALGFFLLGAGFVGGAWAWLAPRHWLRGGAWALWISLVLLWLAMISVVVASGDSQATEKGVLPAMLAIFLTAAQPAAVMFAVGPAGAPLAIAMRAVHRMGLRMNFRRLLKRARARKRAV